MTYQPFLPEAAAGSIQPRHVVVPLRRVLRGAEVISGAVIGRSTTRTRAPRCSRSRERRSDLRTTTSCCAPGSISRTLPIPGLAEWGDRVQDRRGGHRAAQPGLECLDIAESTRDAHIRRRNLTLRGRRRRVRGRSRRSASSRTWPATRRATTARSRRPTCAGCWSRRSDRILPEVGQDMGAYALRAAARPRHRRAGSTPGSSPCVDGHVVLSRRHRVRRRDARVDRGRQAQPVVRAQRAAARRPWPAASARRTLRVEGYDDAWVAGDCAAVPDLTGEPERAHRAPSAQHAVRQAKVLADNIIAVAARQHAARLPAQVRRLGRLARSLQGRRAGLRDQAQGVPGVVHAPHVPRQPGADRRRKVQVVIDWTQALFFRREIVSLWPMHEPFKEFADAANEPPDPLNAAPRRTLATGAPVAQPVRGSRLKSGPVWVRLPPGVRTFDCIAAVHRVASQVTWPAGGDARTWW